jgi:hypothetical protein
MVTSGEDQRRGKRQRPAYEALKTAGRSALRLEGGLRLATERLVEIDIYDRTIDFDFELGLIYRPIQINRSEAGDALVLDHEMVLAIDDEEVEFSDGEDAEIGKLVYRQRWVADGVLIPTDDLQLLLFALTIGRQHATQRARDLILVLSSHLGRPPLVVSEPASPKQAMDQLLDQLRPVMETILTDRATTKPDGVPGVARKRVAKR